MSEEEVEPQRNKTHQPCLSFSSLPNDIAVSCLARIPKSYYPQISLVSKTFRSLISSPELYPARFENGTTEICLYICLNVPTKVFTAPSRRWFSLCVKPERNLTDGRTREKSSGYLFVPFPNTSPPPPPYSRSTVTIGSKIYFFGGPMDDDQQSSSAVRVYNCLSQTWRDLPNMKTERTNASSCVLDDKIYVMGGTGFEHESWFEMFDIKTQTFEHESWFEMFDIKTQTWKTLPPNPELRFGCPIGKICGVEGNIYVKTTKHKISWIYDVKESKWTNADGHLSELCSSSWCVIENVMYSYSSFRFVWYDFESSTWRDVKGLNELNQYFGYSSYFRNWVELVNYGGKLAILLNRFELCSRSKDKSIRCAVVALERSNGGGDIHGNIEWVDVVLTVPRTYRFLCSLAISV